MRGDAEFALAVHLMRADLHFHPLFFGAGDHGVNRAVAVVFGRGDVVIELALQSRPMRMHRRQRGIAIGDAAGQNAHCAQIMQLLEWHVLAPHFFPDAVKVLRAALHFGVYAGRAQCAIKRGGEFADVVFAREARLVQQFRQAAVIARLQKSQRVILHPPFPLAHAEAARERRIYLKRGVRDGVLPLRIGAFAAAQHRQMTRQFDQHHAHIINHRDEHFAQVFLIDRIARAPGQCRELFHPRRAAQQWQNRYAEAGGDGRFFFFIKRKKRLQQCRGQAAFVHLQLAQHRGRMQRITHRLRGPGAAMRLRPFANRRENGIGGIGGGGGGVRHGFPQRVMSRESMVISSPVMLRGFYAECDGQQDVFVFRLCGCGEARRAIARTCAGNFHA